MFRCPRVRRSGGVHPGAIRSEKQINNQRNLLPYDVRNRHTQHSIRIRRRHRRYHSQQSEKLRPLLMGKLKKNKTKTDTHTHTHTEFKKQKNKKQMYT